MADIRCSNCGNDNPDFLDLCQFCQSPLHPDDSLQIGEEPTQKDTGELEEILPSWLKDARQQNREETGADAALKSEPRPRVQNEAPDLLAGLASQADSDDDDDVPDWLASINPVADKSTPASFAKKEAEPSDFFSQFRQTEEVSAKSEPEPPREAAAPAWMGAEPSSSEPEADDNSWMNNLGSFDDTPQAEKESEDLSWLHDLESVAGQSDDTPEQPLSGGFDLPSSSSGEDLSWLDNLGGTPAPEGSAPVQPASSGEDMSWLDNLGGTPVFEESALSQPISSGEDMSWLDNLGGTPESEESAPSQAASSGEDLDWLSNLGDASTPAFEETAPSQPVSSGEDLDWLSNLGNASTPAFEDAAPSRPASSGEDLDWLSNLGDASTPSFEETAPSQPVSSGEDLDWLNNLGDTSTPVSEESTSSQPVSSGEDLDWLSNLGDASTPSQEEIAEQQESQFSTSKPFQTAPLHELLGDEEVADTTPDWLKSAMDDGPSMPSLDDLSTDHSRQHKEIEPPVDEPVATSQPKPVSSKIISDLPISDSSSAGAEDLDSLFNVEMPDWLENESQNTGSSQADKGVPSAATGDDDLAPVELPSWVQAMRPVASSVDDVVSDIEEQVTEQEGPLAGFSGVIPSAPIGSSLRPKAFSLKLRVSDEQQAGATLIEQILEGETTAQAIKPDALVSTQRMLRLILSGVFIIVLGMVLVFGLRIMPIGGSNQLSNLVPTVPDNSQVLVVVDYEPAYAGELEATSGPLLDQLARSRHSTFKFISTSPNGSALVNRLMTKTKITTPDGTKYQLGTDFFNLGYLPGGSAGVLGFIENNKFDAIILMTDNVETGRVWVEQLEIAKVKHPEIAAKPLFVASSARSAPMFQPYASSGQVDIVINGLYDAANYEFVNTTRPGIARVYWDAFGIGLFMAVAAIILGSVWNILMGIRERRAQAEEG